MGKKRLFMIIKPPRVVRSLINKGIDILWEKWLSRGYDPRRTIVVAGTPRGGTTWVAETLAKAPGYLPLMEPEQVFHVAETLAKAPGYIQLGEPLPSFNSNHLGTPGSNARLYVTTNCVLHEHMKRVIAGRVRLSSFLSKIGGLRYFASVALPKMLFFQRFVVKLVHANLWLHWVLKEFDLNGSLIIRHPCAVVASQIHHKFDGEGTGEPKTLEHIRNHRFPIYERMDPSFAQVIRSVNTIEEILAVEWCIRTIVPLRQPKPHPWFLTAYEDLIDGTREWEMLCNYLDCPVPSKGDIQRLSSTSQRRDNESLPSASIGKWRQYLSEKQIDSILRVCSEMGVDLYDKALYPKNLDKYRKEPNGLQRRPTIASGHTANA
jgi:hypothetical protein